MQIIFLYFITLICTIKLQTRPIRLKFSSNLFLVALPQLRTLSLAACLGLIVQYSMIQCLTQDHRAITDEIVDLVCVEADSTGTCFLLLFVDVWAKNLVIFYYRNLLKVGIG